jgi:hypothetical protein
MCSRPSLIRINWGGHPHEQKIIRINEAKNSPRKQIKNLRNKMNIKFSNIGSADKNKLEK